MNSVDRRTVTRTAVWGLPAVMVATAAPAFAATSDTGPKVIDSQREGANFRLRVEAGTRTVAAVTIAGVAASYSGPQQEWTAKLQGKKDSTQPVVISFTDGSTVTLAVYFRE